MRHSQASVSAY